MNYLKYLLIALLVCAWIYFSIWIFNHFMPFLGMIMVLLTPVPFVIYFNNKYKKQNEKSN